MAHIHRVPQVDGGYRLIALDASGARAVRDDPAMIDAVDVLDVLGVLDVDRHGCLDWAPAGPRRIRRHIIDLLRAEAVPA